MRLCTGDHDVNISTSASARRIVSTGASMITSRDARTAINYHGSPLRGRRSGFRRPVTGTASTPVAIPVRSAFFDLEHLFAQTVGGGLHAALHRALEQKTGQRHR